MIQQIYCAIYARYSSHLQRETSIEDQISKCREFAKSKEWIVLDTQIYYDKAQSGTSMIPRKNLNAMLDLAKSGQSPFQYILVDDTSRVARNTREALQIFEELKFANIYCYFVSQGIDGQHETASEILTLHGMVDSLYSRELAKKVRRGMYGQIDRGYYVGSRVFGYRPVAVFTGKKDVHGIPEVAGYKLEINPKEAKVVKYIFKKFAEEWSAKRIANYLNQQVLDNDWPGAPYDKEWTYNTISGSKTRFIGLLNRELYIGKYIWNRRNYRKNPKTGKPKVFYNPPELWKVVLKPELRIISDELWQRAKNRQTYIETKTGGKYVRAKVLYSENLLSRISICGECHSGFVIVIGGKYQYSGYSAPIQAPIPLQFGHLFRLNSGTHSGPIRAPSNA